MATPYRHTLLALSITLAAAAAHAQEETLDTVTVVGQETTDYQAKKAAVAGFDNAPLLDTPASVAVITEARLKDQQARLLSEVLKNDASVGDSYAPVGYYENFVIRGFALNPASSYKINGRTITGEQNVALENKQQVEVLKGLAGLQSGVSEPGGLVNYVSKRPENVRSVTVSTNEQGERYLATDVGGWLGTEQQVGVRINLAHEDIRSYVDHADGKRDFASLALDWNISPNALLQLNAEYQDREQQHENQQQRHRHNDLQALRGRLQVLEGSTPARPVAGRNLDLGQALLGLCHKGTHIAPAHVGAYDDAPLAVFAAHLVGAGCK